MDKNINPAILCIGDAMVDIHLFGKSERLSPEAPVPIVDVQNEEYKLGGAANVAMHIISAGIPCVFAYKSSDMTMLNLFEEDHSDLHNKLCNNNILCHPLLLSKQFPVTTKKRIWSNNQQICRIDTENTDPPDALTENKWFQNIVELFDKYSIKTVICSDYNKGTLTDNLLNMVASFCKSINVPIVLDPKRPSFHKLKNFTIIKPNRKELSLTNMPAHKCSTILGNTLLVNTLGSDGVAVWQKGHCILSAPTVAEEVFDVTGAGDSYNAMLGIALHHEMNITQAVMAANKAASYTVRHRGCYCLNQSEIQECLKYAQEKTTT